MLDFLSYLRQFGCEVEYVSLDPSPNTKFPWCVIPPTLNALANIQVRNNLRVDSVLFRFKPLSNWLTILLRLIYYLLPQHLRTVYLSHITQQLKNIAYLKLTTKKRHEKQVTTNTSVQDLRAILATPEEIAFAKTLFHKFKPDIVIVNYAYLANILDALPNNGTVLKVILTHDVCHQRTAHLRKIGAGSYETDWTWENESKMLCKAQVLLAIQQEDAKVFKEMAPKCEVICMPISAVCHSHTVKPVPGRCLFVGSGTNHNYYGLQWFLDNVWSRLIIQQSPGCSLHVCGSVCDWIKGDFPNVHFLGRVDDLQPEYSAAQVCLIPLLAGSGLKIKLVEAMSYGRACVSTSVGVQGLCEIVGSAVLVADTAEDFAAAIYTLLNNSEKRQWMEAQAHKYVTEKLSPKAVYQPFVDRIEQHLQRLANRL
ncbi:glycosyltransferase [Fischerella sp. JS2]|uniref:glycosyltransferase n=1 Tax=Fischerella sp. JS2 TaxID=2597771 RepID=UPI0028EB6051|nr:glycosyltransferase [Fischerella sp. JS2]